MRESEWTTSASSLSHPGVTMVSLLSRTASPARSVSPRLQVATNPRLSLLCSTRTRLSDWASLASASIMSGSGEQSSHHQRPKK